MNWKWYVTGIFQWREWITRHAWNWRNFTLINVAVESGDYKGNYVEFEFVLLGVGFVVQVYHEPSREAALAPIFDVVRRVDNGTIKTQRLCPTCLQFEDVPDANVKELTPEEARQLELALQDANQSSTVPDQSSA